MPNSGLRRVIVGLVAIGATVALSGWSMPELGPTSPSVERSRYVKACEKFNCESALYADLTALHRSFSAMRRFRICIEDRCRVLRRKGTNHSFRVIRGMPASDKAQTISYLARDQSGQVIVRDSFEVIPRPFGLIGRNCPPPCFEVFVRIDEEGKLGEIPFTA